MGQRVPEDVAVFGTPGWARGVKIRASLHPPRSGAPFHEDSAMALWDKLKNELLDIVEWLDDTNDTLAYRFERYQNEIKYGAKLVVREGQMAAFVNEGKLADVFKPGTYELTTQNMPILATLRGWKYGFNSPFKAEVYFVSTRKFTDL